VNDLRPLAAHRSELGPERFTALLTQASGGTDLAETVTSLLDQLDAAERRHKATEPKGSSTATQGQVGSADRHLQRNRSSHRR
jgi:hypothetical protein